METTSRYKKVEQKVSGLKYFSSQKNVGVNKSLGLKFPTGKSFSELKSFWVKCFGIPTKPDNC